MTAWWLLLLAAGWLAATVSGAAGFGGALLLLPVLTYTFGGRDAVPVLTLAQLLGNVSRAWFGRAEIRWRPALVFSAGAVSAGLLGARLFVALPSRQVPRLIGVSLLVIVVLRHTPWGRRPFPERMLAPAGACIGFLSSLAGSAGPLGAAVFLGLRLPPGAYVATEAVAAALIHLAKSAVYLRFEALDRIALLQGLALGGAMIGGSWTGRHLLKRIDETWFRRLVEVLLAVAGLALIAG